MDHAKNLAENKKKIFEKRYNNLRRDIEQELKEHPQNDTIKELSRNLQETHKEFAKTSTLTMPVLSSLIKKLQEIEKDLEPYLMRSRLNNLEQSLITIKEGLDEVADLIKKGQLSDHISKNLKRVQEYSETQLEFLENLKSLQGDSKSTNIFTPEFIGKLETESGYILEQINMDLQKTLDERTYAKEHRILLALQALWEKICEAVKSLMPHRDTKTRESEQGLAMSHTPAVVFSEDLKNTLEMQALVEQLEDELIKEEQQNTARKASAAQRRDFQ